MLCLRVAVQGVLVFAKSGLVHIIFKPLVLHVVLEVCTHTHTKQGEHEHNPNYDELARLKLVVDSVQY